MRISDWSSDVCSSDLALAARAYARGRTMIWTKMAERAAGLLAEVQTTRPARLPSVQRLANLEPDLSAVLRMTDATGMLQHSIYSIPDRLHGYCLDDNARALILINHMPGMDEGERDRLKSIYASSVSSEERRVGQRCDSTCKNRG